MSSTAPVEAAFGKFVEIIKALRTPETGCPWDLEQDHLSLRPYFIEETYEALAAIEQQDDKALCDELGDVLLQVVLHAQVAADRGAFGIGDVIEGVSKKMIRRHPHVFGETKVTGSAEVLKNWEQIKASEAGSAIADGTKADNKDGAEASSSAGARLAKIPHSIPALLRAQRIGEKAAQVHFDWDAIEGVAAKVKEEWQELEEEIRRTDLPASGVARSIEPSRRQALEHELGDLLFSICQLARWLGVSAEDSLRTCSARFIDRFMRMEAEAASPLSELTAEQLEAMWQRAKTAEIR